MNWCFTYPSNKVSIPSGWKEFRIYHFVCEAMIFYSCHTYIVLYLSTFNFICHICPLSLVRTLWSFHNWSSPVLPYRITVSSANFVITQHPLFQVIYEYIKRQVQTQTPAWLQCWSSSTETVECFLMPVQFSRAYDPFYFLHLDATFRLLTDTIFI